MNRFTVSSRGLGDIKLTGLLLLKENIDSKWLMNFGINLPTGETNVKDVMVMMSGMHMHSTLGYGMQLGSGTYDPILKIGYNKKINKASVGWQTSGTWRVYHNKNNTYINVYVFGTLDIDTVNTDALIYRARPIERKNREERPLPESRGY